jgi:D-lyxose ketol-isomerase
VSLDPQVKEALEEADSIEVADFGLGNLEKEGVQALALVQTDRISVKVLALLPDQTVPEHWHPPVDGDPGKEETIRVITGTVYSLNFFKFHDTEGRGKIERSG